MCALRNILFFLFVPVCASAQPAPTVATTLVTTHTGPTSICVGGNNPGAPTTCTGGMMVGTVKFGSNATPVVNGSLQKAAATGLTIVGVAGSSYDWSLYTPNTVSLVIGNTTGTQNVVFGGTLTSAGAIVATSSDITAGDDLIATDAISAGGNGTIGGTLDVTGVSTLTGATRAIGGLSIGSTNVTDAAASTSIVSGCGSGSLIAGKPFAFVVTIGTGSPSTCTVGFNTVFTNAPVCVASGASTSAFPSIQTVTTAQLVIGTTGFSDGEKTYVICRGY